KLSGIGLPCISASFGFGSNVSRCDGPPAIVSQITRLAFCGRGNGVSTPRTDAALRSAGCVNDASATAPSPCDALLRNARLDWSGNGEKFMAINSSATELRKDFLDDSRPFNARQFGVEALEFDAERVVLDAKLVQHRGMEVVNVADVLDSRVAEVVRRA